MPFNSSILCGCPLVHGNRGKVCSTSVTKRGELCTKCLSGKDISRNISKDTKTLLSFLYLVDIQSLYDGKETPKIADIMSGLYHMNPHIDWDKELNHFRSITGDPSIAREVYRLTVDTEYHFPILVKH